MYDIQTDLVFRFVFFLERDLEETKVSHAMS